MSDNGKRMRLFLDSNVVTGGIVARRGLDRALLAICTARVANLVLAEAVRDEVEGNLREHAPAEDLAGGFRELLESAKPEIVPYPSEARVLASRRLIAHAADVPVLVSAIDSKPDWLITHNTRHFTPKVAEATGLRIATPIEFFRHWADAIASATRL